LGGVLACGVYIDLNPIRAGIAKTPEESNFTSVQDRIAELRQQSSQSMPSSIPSERPAQSPKLMPTEEFTKNSLSPAEYIELVDRTGRMLRREKRGVIPVGLDGVLTRLNLNTNNWAQGVSNFGRLFTRIVGDPEALKTAAEGVRKKWFKGKEAAEFVFCT
jgi:hypothetical protein